MKPFTKALAAVAAGALAVASASAQTVRPGQAADTNIGTIDIGNDITLRRMVVRNPEAKGVVLFLHGFPETLYAWQDVSKALADDFEVHAFDWPGFGQSSRPSADKFAYAPKDYARVLADYIDKAGIDRSKLTIYATDIGALPALLAALEQPSIAKTIIVGDFAPFNRPEFMQDRLQALKVRPTAELVRAALNTNRDEILENATRRGLPKEAQFELSQEFKVDMARGWGRGEMTSADAFYYYYSHFTRDQEYFEENLARLKTPVKVVWGADDFYIQMAMGMEFARRASAPLTLLPGVGHYPHLQTPQKTAEEIRATLP